MDFLLHIQSLMIRNCPSERVDPPSLAVAVAVGDMPWMNWNALMFDHREGSKFSRVNPGENLTWSNDWFHQDEKESCASLSSMEMSFPRTPLKLLVSITSKGMTLFRLVTRSQ